MTEILSSIFLGLFQLCIQPCSSNKDRIGDAKQAGPGGPFVFCAYCALCSVVLCQFNKNLSLFWSIRASCRAVSNRDRAVP